MVDYPAGPDATYQVSNYLPCDYRTHLIGGVLNTTQEQIWEAEKVQDPWIPIIGVRISDISCSAKRNRGAQGSKNQFDKSEAHKDRRWPTNTNWQTDDTNSTPCTQYHQRPRAKSKASSGRSSWEPSKWETASNQSTRASTSWWAESNWSSGSNPFPRSSSRKARSKTPVRSRTPGRHRDNSRGRSKSRSQSRDTKRWVPKTEP